MGKYITYYIKTLEDVKLSKTVNQIDFEGSLDYIRGSSVRGAYISKYISSSGKDDVNNDENRFKFLAGGIKFLNAYPVCNDDRSIPAFKCYFASKDDIKKDENRFKIVSILDSDIENLKPINANFFYFNSIFYEKINVKKTSHLHINTTGKNKLFRYDAIKSNQIFKGIIKVEKEEFAQDIIDTLNNLEVYIGGSKGSGYGKCYIYDMCIENINPELSLCENWFFSDSIYIVALSDIIYRAETGEYKSYIDEEFLKNKFGINDGELKYENGCVEVKDISSYNNKWNCRLPHIKGISAGSILKYNTTGNIDIEKIKALMDEGIGERKQDGYGRILVLSDLSKESELENEVTFEKKENIPIIDEKEKKDKELIEEILTSIVKNRVKSSINEIVLKINKNIKETQSNSQWGNFKDLFEDMMYLNSEEGKEKYKVFIEKFSNKQSSNLYEFERIKYRNSESFKNFLYEFIENSNNIQENYVKKYNQNIGGMNINNIKSKMDEEYIYKVNIKVLFELCRYKIRKES